MTENHLILSYQQQYWDHDHAYNAGPAKRINLSLAAVTDRELRNVLEQIVDHPCPEEKIITHGAGLAGIDIEPELIRVAQKLQGRTLTGPWYMRLLVGVEDTYGALSDWLLTHPFIEHRPSPEQDPSKGTCNTTMDEIEDIVNQQGWNDQTRLQLAEDFIESSGQLDAYIQHLRQTAAEESTDEVDELDEPKNATCHICAEPFVIEADGIANHVDEYGNINHDLDEDHVPYTLED